MAKIKISSESTISSEEAEVFNESFIMHNPTLEPPPKPKLLKQSIRDQFATGIITIAIVGASHPVTSIEYFTGKVEDIFNNFQCFVDRMLNRVTEEPSQNSEYVSQAPSVKSEKAMSPGIDKNGMEILNINNGNNNTFFKPPQTSVVKVFKDKTIGKRNTSINSDGRVSTDSMSSGVSRPDSEGLVSTSSSTSYYSKRNSDIRSSISSTISSSSECSRRYMGPDKINIQRQSVEKEIHEESHLSMVPETDSKEEEEEEENTKEELEEMDNDESETDTYSYVYALFPNDSYFYPGKKKSHNTNNVIFGNSQKVKVKPIDIYDETFLPLGTEVEITLDDGITHKKGFYVNKTMLKTTPYNEHEEEGYEVVGQDNSYEIYRHQARVREDIMRLIMEREREDEEKEHETSLSNISIGNILDGKRRRKPKRNSIYVVESPLKRCGSPSIFALQKSKRVKKLCTNPSNKKEATNNHLFQGKYFFITSGVDGEEGESIRKDLIHRIIVNDGTVVEYPKFSLLDRNQFISNVILIVIGSISEIWKRRTMKYLYALAINNIPIINPKWVDDSIRNKCIMDIDNYCYNRGIHPITNEIVPGNITKSENNIQLFANLKVWIVDYEQTEFSRQWEQIIELAGGKCQLLNLGDFSPNLDKSTCHLVLGEKDGVTRRLLDRLSSLDISIVTAEFFMDSLISNEVLDIQNYTISDF